jgi:hypothetical protein
MTSWETHVKVIATGGYAPIIAQRARIIESVEPTLVLDGVRAHLSPRDRVLSEKTGASPVLTGLAPPWYDYGLV